MEYICKVGTPSGEIVERSFDAPNEESLKAELVRQGLFLFSHRKAARRFKLGSPRVKPENLQLFGQELAALLKAGLPLAQGMDLPATVLPFILRNITLAGIDSVNAPNAVRLEAYARLARDLDLAKLDSTITEYGLAGAPKVAQAVVRGEIRGRAVIDVRR